MSVAQLEELVSCLVGSSCGNRSESERVASKPKRWSRDVAFSYPLTRARTTDSAKWRETLLNVVARCTNRSKDCVLRGTQPSPRRRLKAPAITVKATDENQNDNIVCKNIPQEKQPFLECSPVVRLCDIMKLQVKENSTAVKKTDFLNYFKLSDTQNFSVIVNSNACKRYQHPLHLLNSQNVPFSSDLGRKLTKECHFVSEDIHQRKIERVERYLTTVINTDTAKVVEYEVSFNKQPRYSHTYVFPNKIYRRKGRISSKATFLLINYCKPCTVRLDKLPMVNLDKNVVSTKTVPTYTSKQEENTLPSKKKIFNSVSKENLLPIPVNITPTDICIRNKKEPTVLQTMVPKIESSILQQNNHRNSSIVSSPIKDLLGLNSPKSKKKNNNKSNNIKRSKRKVGNADRVQKKRVIIYETRRFSLRVLRLRCVRNK